MHERIYLYNTHIQKLKFPEDVKQKFYLSKQLHKLITYLLYFVLSQTARFLGQELDVCDSAKRAAKEQSKAIYK